MTECNLRDATINEDETRLAYLQLLLAKGWRITRASCTCGGEFAWLRPRPSGAFETAGCICHQDPINLVEEQSSELERLKLRDRVHAYINLIIR